MVISLVLNYIIKMNFYISSLVFEVRPIIVKMTNWKALIWWTISANTVNQKYLIQEEMAEISGIPENKLIN